MRRACWLVLGWLIVASLVRADWRILTVETGQCRGEAVRTEYFKGKLRRSDDSLNGVAQATTVIEADEKLTEWDAARTEYTSISLKPVSSPAQVAATPVVTQGSVVHIDIETVDTGERQTLFGRSARHLITTERRSQEEPAGFARRVQSETVRDAWYMDAAGLPGEKQQGKVYTTMLLSFAGQAPIIKTHRTGPTPTGMIVREKITRRDRGQLFARTGEIEVRELEEGSFSSSLFEVPADFHRVDRLADTSFTCQPTSDDELEMYWNNFEYWLSRWFS